jgi:SAM-dependent methyltransferase
VVGVEVDAEAAQLAATYVERVHAVDLETVRLSSLERERFDVLLLGDVLEHFRDPVAVLGDLLTLLDVGGVVVASVPHVAHVDVRLMLLEGHWDYQPDGLLDATHVRWFTREGLRRLLAACGLVATRVERVTVAMGGSNVPCHPELHDEQTLDFLRADPEWQTYQFVVTAERAAGQPDALAGSEPQWPQPNPHRREGEEPRRDLPPGPQPAARTRLLRGRAGMAEIHARNEGPFLDKWLHYFPIYERHFAPFRGTSAKLLEIGVSHGGSLELWRRWFGRGTQIVGVDIDERCASLARPGVEIRIGSQGDRAFLERLAADDGPFDIVIDDGSHWPADQLASIEVLWAAVRPGGVYLVEDLHTNYWPEYGCAPRQAGTFVELTKSLLDELNAFHSHTPDFQPSHWTRTLGGVHVYDSVVVLDRVDRLPPERRMTGRPVFDTIYGYDSMSYVTPEHRAEIERMSTPLHRLRRAVRSPRATAHRIAAKLHTR